MQTIASARPGWATVINTGIDDAVWVELDSGSIVPIDASAEMRDLLDVGVSVLVDLDSKGEAASAYNAPSPRPAPNPPERSDFGSHRRMPPTRIELVHAV